MSDDNFKLLILSSMVQVTLFFGTALVIAPMLENIEKNIDKIMKHLGIKEDE